MLVTFTPQITLHKKGQLTLCARVSTILKKGYHSFTKGVISRDDNFNLHVGIPARITPVGASAGVDFSPQGRGWGRES